MLKLLADNWAVLAGLAIGIAFLLERTFHFIADRKKKAQAYNHCLLDMVKLQFAYIKQKELLFNPQFRQLPLVFHLMLSRGNDLQAQLTSFNAQMAKEAALVPELILQSNVMTNIMERLFLLEQIYAGSELTEEIIATLYNTQRALLESAIGGMLGQSLYEMAKIAIRYGSLSATYRARLLHVFDPKNAGQINQLSNDYMNEFWEKLSGQQ